MFKIIIVIWNIITTTLWSNTRSEVVTFWKANDQKRVLFDVIHNVCFVFGGDLNKLSFSVTNPYSHTKKQNNTMCLTTRARKASLLNSDDPQWSQGSWSFRSYPVTLNNAWTKSLSVLFVWFLKSSSLIFSEAMRFSSGVLRQERSSSLSLIHLWSLCLLFNLDNSKGLFVTTRKLCRGPANSHPPPPTPTLLFNNLGCMRRHSCWESARAGWKRLAAEQAAATPTPSLPSASRPQPSPRHQRQVEWNHEITGKVSITLWNQALSKSRQDPAGPWN